MAFQPETPREVINVVSVNGTLDLQYNDLHKEKQYRAFECRKMWLQPHVVGQELALEAAEALYQSRFLFAVHAHDCLDFISQCPLSRLANPGLSIARLLLFMDEEKNFIGDGKRGTGLRLADWYSLTQDCTERRQTRSMQGRTALMRRCWRGIFRMPRLIYLECRVMPVGGRMSSQRVKSWEIRDMLPALWHLWKRGVSIGVYFRTWDELKPISTNFFQYRQISAQVSDPEDPPTVEKAIDVGICLPFADVCMGPPSDKDRLQAFRVQRQGLDKCLPYLRRRKDDMFVASQGDICMYHRIQFYDALADLSKRLFPRTGKICEHHPQICARLTRADLEPETSQCAPPSPILMDEKTPRIW